MTNDQSVPSVKKKQRQFFKEQLI